MHNLGRYLIASTTLDAGTGAETLFRVFTAGEKPVALANVQYYGGDNSEGMQLFLIPPNAFVTGMKPSDQAGAVAISNAATMSGGKGTIEAPSTVLGAPMDGRWPLTVIPPFASIACSLNASNTTAMTVTMGGFEINA